MCTGDAMRLCGHEIPNVQRNHRLHAQQRANVSAGCRAVMDRDNTAAPASLGRRVIGDFTNAQTASARAMLRQFFLSALLLACAIELKIDFQASAEISSSLRAHLLRSR
jgi:hypothetical protein